MKNTKLKTTLASVTLAAATLAFSLPAHAQDYRNCSDTTNSVAGGLIGGSVGAVAGREIAGRGDRSEGAIIGAIIGGIAGAAIGDGANDCEKDARFNNRGVVTTTNYPVRNTVSNRVVQTVSYDGRNNASYGNNRNFGNVSYGYNNRNNRRQRLYEIECEIDELRRERTYLKRQQKRSRRFNPRIENRIDRIDYRLDDLRRLRKRLK